MGTKEKKPVHKVQMTEGKRQITTIFAPLTLITGWYGMNFRHMPELEYKWSYPLVLLISLGIALGCITYFKKKKWM